MGSSGDASPCPSRNITRKRQEQRSTNSSWLSRMRRFPYSSIPSDVNLAQKANLPYCRLRACDIFHDLENVLLTFLCEWENFERRGEKERNVGRQWPEREDEQMMGGRQEVDGRIHCFTCCCLSCLVVAAVCRINNRPTGRERERERDAVLNRRVGGSVCLASISLVSTQSYQRHNDRSLVR